MLKMSRKEFLRTGLSIAAASALPAPIVAGTARAAAKPGDGSGAALIPRLNPVLRLYPDGAVKRSGDIRFGQAEIGTMLPFLGSGEAVWTVTVPEAGRYDLALCYSSTHPNTPLSIQAGETKIDFAAPVTEGFFYPHPQGPVENPGDPGGESFFRMREYYLFDRIAVPGEFVLSRGVNVVRLRVSGDKGREILRLRAIELTPVAQRAAVAADKARAGAHRVKADWFAHAGYGLWFHFLDLTTPPHGPRKPYEQAVNELDVEKLAETVAACGASYLIFTVNHGNPTCPAPIKSWEKLHPGWTTKRDLVNELADALGRRGIRLMLYMNLPGLGGMDLIPGTALGTPAFNEVDFATQLIDVFREFGTRYGPKVAGYWFDSWFETTECYPNLPYETFAQAIRTGHPGRIFAYNNWVFPMEVEWHDYWAGELTDLPLKPLKGRYVQHSAANGLQAHVALRFDADWLHMTPDKPMEPPRFTAAELAAFIRSCQEIQVPVTLGVGIFQDGSLGERSVPILKELRRLVRGDSPDSVIGSADGGQQNGKAQC